MRLGAIIIIGYFFNIMLAVSFPYQFGYTALLEGEEIGYTFEDDSIFPGEAKQGINENYETLTDSENIQALTDTEGGIISSLVGGVSALFDGLFDGIKKLGSYIAFLTPFGTIFLALPGALGVVMGLIYMVLIGYGIVTFIAGR
jgi:hypothetical protein